MKITMKNEIDALKRFSFRQFLTKKLIDIEIILNRDLKKTEIDAIMKYKKIADCKHENTSVRRWLRTDGRQYVKNQCDDCGVRHGPCLLLEGNENAPFGCEESHLQKNIVNQITYAIYTETARTLHKKNDPKNEDDHEKIKRQRAYQTYMSSDAWRQKRLLVLERDDHRCIARMKGCTIKADHVHHITYENLGDEPLWELASVCLNCHRRIHN